MSALETALVAVGGTIIATGAAYAGSLVLGIAHADPNDLNIMDYGTKHGHAICQIFDRGDVSMDALIQAIMNDSGFNAHNSVQVVGFSIVNYCPKYQPLLTQWQQQHGSLTAGVNAEPLLGVGRYGGTAC
jgi:Protein of unknown function (DUF732)